MPNSLRRIPLNSLGLFTMTICIQMCIRDRDRVVKTVPAFPDQAEEGSVVVIYVSTGEEEPEPISVPNVINLGLEDAKTQLRNAGFIVNDPAAKRCV